MIFDSMNNFMQYGKLAPAAWEKILKFFGQNNIVPCSRATNIILRNPVMKLYVDHSCL